MVRAFIWLPLVNVKPYVCSSLFLYQQRKIPGRHYLKLHRAVSAATPEGGGTRVTSFVGGGPSESSLEGCWEKVKPEAVQ